MTDDGHLTYTPRQLQAYEVLQRIKMAWVALWFILILFSIGLLSFLAALFWVDRAGIAKTLLGGVDTLLGLALRTVMANLFPPPKAQVSQRR